MLAHVVSLDSPTAIALLLNQSTIHKMRVNYRFIGVPCLKYHSLIPEIGPTQFLLYPFLVCFERLIHSFSVITDARLNVQ